MKPEEIMKEALTLLQEDYKKEYKDWESARRSAYAFLFGATLSVIEKKQAEHLLEVIKQYVDEQEEARNVK
jgi:6-phosphogluconate dehydrogenase